MTPPKRAPKTAVILFGTSLLCAIAVSLLQHLAWQHMGDVGFKDFPRFIPEPLIPIAAEAMLSPQQPLFVVTLLLRAISLVLLLSGIITALRSRPTSSEMR